MRVSWRDQFLRDIAPPSVCIRISGDVPAFDAILLEIDNRKIPATFDDALSRTLPRRRVRTWTRRSPDP